MEVYLFRPDEYARLYNCTGSEEWINKHSLEERTQFVPQAWATIIMCTIFYVLYIPVMLSIWKHIKGNSCYQLLFYIGLTDMLILWILGFVHGYLSLTGAIYCSYPNFIYITGVLCNSIWRAESCADLLLAFNRCLDMAYPELGKALFQGYKTSLWLLLITAYFMWWIIFSKPAVFSSLHFGWFFNPYLGYREDLDGTYVVPMHTYHDLFIVIAFPTIYAVFMIMMHMKTRASSRMGHNSHKISKAELMTFIQVVLISLLNSCAAFLYIYMQFVSSNQFLVTLGEFGWFLIHGTPPVIFLALNKTVRHDCYKLFFKTFKRNQVTHIHGVTVIRPDTEQLRRQQQTTY